MAIDRRTFLLGLAAVGLAPSMALGGAGPARFVGCRSTDDDRHFLSGIDDNGRVAFDIALPARGHGFAVEPRTGMVAVFARRPGEYVWLIDTARGAAVQRISSPPGRHFYGHGAFTGDGRLLCSENNFDTGEGVIGVYAPLNDGERLGELPSHGVGPHQIMLGNDGQTLLVANGGIQTHPDLPRVKQNLGAMRPNLAHIDIRDGRLLHCVEPPAEWHQLSIRHLDIAPDDTVAIAMQFEGNPLKQPPLIGLQRGDGALELLHAPEQVQAGMKNYCGSVAFDTTGEQFAVTSPRGGIVTYWSKAGEYLGRHRQADACGVAHGLEGHRFVVSDGTGVIRQVDHALSVADFSGPNAWRWDNHLVAI